MMNNEIKKNEVEFLSRKILELNKQLIESEKAKTRFLSLVANELNNPMTALLGLIPHLIPSSGDSRMKIYDMVHEEALMLEFRIQNLVAAAQIESGECDIAYASVDLKTIVDEAIDSLKYAIRAKNMMLVIEDNLNQNVVSDPQKLFLILQNLLSNALTYGDDNSIIEIVLVKQGETLALSVKNQGEGPNVEFKPQVFTRFAGGPSGLHGLGLGLSVVRSFCEALEGNVDYTAGEGNVAFCVTLPLKTTLPDSTACGSNEFLFESFDDAIEI